MALENLKEAFRPLLQDPIVGTLGVVTPDGKSHQSVIWRLYVEPYIVFFTETDTVKYEAIQQNKNVSLVCVDPQNPYRYLLVEGTVEKIETDNPEMIDRISMFYTGKPYNKDVVDDDANRNEEVVLYIRPDDFTPVDVE